METLLRSASISWCHESSPAKDGTSTTSGLCPEEGKYGGPPANRVLQTALGDHETRDGQEVAATSPESKADQVTRQGYHSKYGSQAGQAGGEVLSS